jgi:hypothetical protein
VVEDTTIMPLVAGVVTCGPVDSGSTVVVRAFGDTTGPDGKGGSGGKCPLAPGLISLGWGRMGFGVLAAGCNCCWTNGASMDGSEKGGGLPAEGMGP